MEDGEEQQGLSPKDVSDTPSEPAQGAAVSPATEEPAGETKRKIDVLLKAVGDTPIMRNKKWTIERIRTVQGLMDFIKKYLKLDSSEQLFIYVNQSFAPSPDQEVGTLYEAITTAHVIGTILLTIFCCCALCFCDCFGSDGKLVLHYCKSQAWG